jgi:two-component system cell cycle sensor histidine kinase/response regulator CckA
MEARESASLKKVDCRGTVLVAEDEEAMARLLEKILTEHGYQVLVARDGEEAVELYNHHGQEVDVVLLDIGLPKMAGWDVVAKIREKNPNVNVVVASGYIEPAVKSKMYQLGVKDFIYKPYIPEHIVDALQALIDKP